MPQNMVLEGGGVPGRGLGMEPDLQVTIEIFIGIQFGRVRREKEHFEPLGVAWFREPGLDRLRMVDTQIVEDQKDLLVRPLEELVEKLN